MPPPVWQREAVTAQMKYLKRQKDTFSSLMDQINSVLIEVDDWIKGEGNCGTSYLEMCQMVETVFNDISTKCLDISKNHTEEVAPNKNVLEKMCGNFQVLTVNEESVTKKANILNNEDENKLSENNMKQSTQKKLDLMEQAIVSLKNEMHILSDQQQEAVKAMQDNTTKVMTRCEAIDTISLLHAKDKEALENQQQIYEQDIKSLKNENSLKIDSFLSELLAASDFMSAMQSQIDFLAKKVDDAFSEIKSSLTLPLKDELKIILAQLEESKSSSLKQNNQTNVNYENMIQRISSIEENYAMVCQLLSRRLTSLEHLRDTFNQNLLAREEKEEQWEEFSYQVSEIKEELSYLSCPTVGVKEDVGFNARLPVDFSKGKNIINFTDVRLNFGDHFEPSKGIFTSPSDGLYLIYLCIGNLFGKIMFMLVKQENGSKNFDVIFQDTVDSDKNVCLITVEKLKKKEQ
ncbi:unnamed protein product, partial [Lymnaea stagnalis]